MGLSREARIYLFAFLAVTFLFSVMVILLPFGGGQSGDGQSTQSADNLGEPHFDLSPSSFAALSGWEQDDHAMALPVFLRSCAKLMQKPDNNAANPIEALGKHNKHLQSIAGTIGDWRGPCARGKALHDLYQSDSNGDGEDYKRDAKAFFENEFTPFKIINHYRDETDTKISAKTIRRDDDGLFTGYFEPIYKASSKRADPYLAPVYARPPDLIEIDLGKFRENLAGVRIAGRLKEGRLYPYEDHREINAGALTGKSDILAWMDPNDLLFLQIQGSGQLILEKDEIVRLGYAAQNGHPYTAIGKPLLERGAIPRDKISLQTIREWLDKATKEEAQNLREENASYVFFRKLNNLPDPSLGPLGAQGVQLTSRRSLAADRRYHAMGTPVWLDIGGDEGGQSLRQLMIIQDTGGAIRGPVRGDVYWGSGDEAKAKAGVMKARGTMTVFIPNAAAKRVLKAIQQSSVPREVAR